MEANDLIDTMADGKLDVDVKTLRGTLVKVEA